MEDDVIRKNDLVMIVRASICCGNDKHIGRMFNVDEIVMGALACRNCKKISLIEAAGKIDGAYVALQLLKKIHPLSDPEIIEDIEEAKV